MSGPTCSYCGQQIEPGQLYCPTCGTHAPAPPVTPVEPAATPAPEPVDGITDPVRPALWTERQWRIFELALVCAVAFAISVLHSAEIFFIGNRQATSRSTGEMAWVYVMVRQGIALALLWYILQRRSKTFRGLGLRWSLKEVAFGCLLFVGGGIAYGILHWLIHVLMAALNWPLGPQPNVSVMLYGSRVAVMAIVSDLLNPFYEELIVRAFVMTEVKALTNNLALAIAASVLLQTSYHFYQGAPAALSHFGTFLVFALYYAKTNRIGAPVAAHLLLDLSATLLYMARLHQRAF